MAMYKRGLSSPTMSSTPQESTGVVGSKEFHLAPHLFNISNSLNGEPSPVLRSHPVNARAYNTPDHLSLDTLINDDDISSHTSTEKPYKLDPHIRLHIEKLEVALRYLGLEPTPKQHERLLQQLNIDPSGTVPYGEFVTAAKNVFKIELKEQTTITHQLTSDRIRDITDPPAIATPVHDFNLNADVFQLQLENDKLKRKIAKLQIELKDRENSCITAEDELLRARQEAQGALEETRMLRSRVLYAEQAQKAAHNIETDYDDVIRALETKISNLQTQQAKQLESPAVQRRLAVLSCQAKKSEASKKTYEVATEKLLNFLETLYEGLLINSTGSNPNRLKKKQVTLQGMAKETHDMIKGIRSLVEIEPLPFGWDEAYTEDGMKYYMNHVTQVTQWTHPVSKVTRMSPLPRRHHKSSQQKPFVFNVNNSNSVMESSA